MAQNKISIIEVPSEPGATFGGISRSPAAMKAVGIVEKLQALGYDISLRSALPDGPVVWKESTTAPNGARNEPAAIVANRAAMTTVLDELGKGRDSGSSPPFQLLIGGDCSIAPAAMSAFAHQYSSQRVGLLYVDADTDLVSPAEPGCTGILGAMAFTHLTLRHGALESMKPFSRPDGSGVVDSSNCILYGINTNWEANKREHLGFLFDGGYKVVTSAAVAKDATDRAKEALRWLEERVDYIYIHFDVDAIDCGLFPLGNFPNWSGAGFDEVMTAINTFLGSRKAVGLNLAEQNPDRDPGLAMTRRLVDKVCCRRFQSGERLMFKTAKMKHAKPIFFSQVFVTPFC